MGALEEGVIVTAQITLNEEESTALRTIAERTGKTEDELLREAVHQFIQRFRPVERRALLQQACGMWRDRADLPSLETLRTEFDRF